MADKILLTRHEIQSGLNRQRHAEGLILQLPGDHDGRNTWLMNYGVGIEAQLLRDKKNLRFDTKTKAAESANAQRGWSPEGSAYPRGIAITAAPAGEYPDYLALADTLLDMSDTSGDHLCLASAVVRQVPSLKRLIAHQREQIAARDRELADTRLRLERMQELAEFWILQGQPGPHPSKEDYNKWLALGFHSGAWAQRLTGEVDSAQE